MKIFYFIFLIPVFSFGQVTFTTLDQNNVSAGIMSNGIIGYQPQFSAHAYEAPKGNGVHALYEVSPIYSTNNSSGMLYGNLPFYSPNSGGFWGPMANDYNDSWLPQKRFFFSINEAIVENHILNWDTPGYIMNPQIENWPGNGNPSIGTSDYLAPFEDVNNNGIYDPENGDYPIMFGEYGMYSIYSYDSIINPNINNSSTLPIEVNNYIYQNTSISGLENVTFIMHRVTNHSADTLFDFKWGLFTDFDLGNPYDDYIGTNELLNLYYAYNSTNLDQNAGSYQGYGQNPPAVGVVSLNNKLYKTNHITFGGGSHDVNNLAALNNIMNGLEASGAPNLNSQGNIIDFLYTGDPNETGSESQYQLGEIPMDQKGLLSLVPVDFLPGESKCFHFAIVFAGEENDHLESVQELFETTEQVIQYYNDNINYNCEMRHSTASLNYEEGLTINVYPNPSSDIVNVMSSYEITNISISGLDGRAHGSYNKKNKIPISHLNNGIYLMRITTTKGEMIKKIQVQR